MLTYLLGEVRWAGRDHTSSMELPTTPTHQAVTDVMAVTSGPVTERWTEGKEFWTGVWCNQPREKREGGCVCVRERVPECVYVFTWCVCGCMCVCLRGVCVVACVCVFTWCVCVCVFTSVCLRVCVCVCVCVCVYWGRADIWSAETAVNILSTTAPDRECDKCSCGFHRGLLWQETPITVSTVVVCRCPSPLTCLHTHTLLYPQNIH